MGNDDNTAMEKNSGGRYPARLFHDYMNDAIGFDLQRDDSLYDDSVSESFTRMLNSLSSGSFGGFTGNTDRPTYNR